MTQFLRGLLVLILFSAWTVHAQKHVAPPEKDKAIARDLKEKFPDDNVAIVESKVHVSFDIDKRNELVTVNEQEITDLINLDSRADIQLYSFYDGETEIEYFDIFTKNQKKAYFAVKDEAYKSDDLFHNDVRVKYAHLDFPVNAFTYTTTVEKEYKDLKYFTSIYFIDDYPIASKTIEIEVPDWLDMDFKEKNFEGYKVKKEITEGKNGSRIFTYHFEDMPAVFKEENTPGPSYVYPHILILPKSFKLNGEELVIFKSTQDLYNWYRSLVDELENDNQSLKEKVAELTMNAPTDEEKIRNIYYWIQDNIRYIAFEDGIAGFKPDEASNVYHKRYGDCKGMANLTKQMLLEAGFDARLTWIGTKHIAYDYSTPNLSVDNHMICTVIKDQDTLFLDGTEKFNSMGEYADRIQGKQVLIENGNDFLLKYIPVHKAEFNAQKFNYHMKLVKDQIVGEVSKKYFGESRSGLLYYFHSLKNDKKGEFLEWYLNNGNSNIKVSNIETSDLSNRDLNVDIEYDIEIKNAVSQFDDVIYVDLDLDKEFSGYKLDKRETDYIFGSKKDIHSVFELEIPKGYKISHLPENLSLSSDNYELSVNFSKKEGQLIYEKQFRIKNAKIETTDFGEWNEFIDRLNNIYSEQIILTKKS